MKTLCIKIGVVALVLAALLGNGSPARANATSIRSGVSIALEQLCKSRNAGLSAVPIYTDDLLCRVYSLVHSSQLAVRSARNAYSFNWDVVAL